MSEPTANIFRFCPRCGGDAATPVGANPFRCGKCEFTHYFSPITAVGAIVADSEGQILLITRARDPGKGKLGMPGGFVDPGETLETAIVREVLEETNLTATSTEYLISFPNKYDYLGVIGDITDAFFVCKVDSFDSIKPQEGEITACNFVTPSPEHLDNLAFESNRKALEFYLSQRS